MPESRAMTAAEYAAAEGIGQHLITYRSAGVGLGWEGSPTTPVCSCGWTTEERDDLLTAAMAGEVHKTYAVEDAK